jgi:hypothetical protein
VSSGSFDVYAYAADGTQLEHLVLPGSTSAGAVTPFSLAGGGTSFSYVLFSLATLSDRIVLDDLSYVNDPLALPAWHVSRTGVAGPASTFAGGSAPAMTFSLNRSNGSSGTLTPTVTGLAAGVTAQITRTDFTGTSSGTFTVTVCAAAVSLDDHGSPAAGVGDSASLQIVVASPVQFSRSSGSSRRRSRMRTSIGSEPQWRLVSRGLRRQTFTARTAPQ